MAQVVVKDRFGEVLDTQQIPTSIVDNTYSVEYRPRWFSLRNENYVQVCLFEA